nr:MAG TPA: hypothetical protein [Bacteriophage sp.]
MQALIPPLLPEQGRLPRPASAEIDDKPTIKAIDNTANFFIVAFPF